MDSSEFNARLLVISDSLTAEQLDRLKFLSHDVIGKGALEKCDTGFKLFDLLKQRVRLGPDKTDYLCGLLSDINRQDLCEKLLGSSGDRRLTVDQRDQMDRAAEVLSESLGRNWRKLGRKLGLSEVRLESISQKHPHSLEDTAVELVREWRRRSQDRATLDALIKALRDCALNLSADTLETLTSEQTPMES